MIVKYSNQNMTRNASWKIASYVMVYCQNTLIFSTNCCHSIARLFSLKTAQMLVIIILVSM